MVSDPEWSRSHLENNLDLLMDLINDLISCRHAVISWPIRQDWRLQALSDLEKLTLRSRLWVLVHQGLSVDAFTTKLSVFSFYS